MRSIASTFRVAVNPLRCPCSAQACAGAVPTGVHVFEIPKADDDRGWPGVDDGRMRPSRTNSTEGPIERLRPPILRVGGAHQHRLGVQSGQLADGATRHVHAFSRAPAFRPLSPIGPVPDGSARAWIDVTAVVRATMKGAAAWGGQASASAGCFLVEVRAIRLGPPAQRRSCARVPSTGITAA
jgi:hypothetical protein